MSEWIKSSSKGMKSPYSRELITAMALPGANKPRITLSINDEDGFIQE